MKNTQHRVTTTITTTTENKGKTAKREIITHPTNDRTPPRQITGDLFCNKQPFPGRKGQSFPSKSRNERIQEYVTALYAIRCTTPNITKVTECTKPTIPRAVCGSTKPYNVLFAGSHRVDERVRSYSIRGSGSEENSEAIDSSCTKKVSWYSTFKMYVIEQRRRWEGGRN